MTQPAEGVAASINQLLRKFFNEEFADGWTPEGEPMFSASRIQNYFGALLPSVVAPLKEKQDDKNS